MNSKQRRRKNKFLRRVYVETLEAAYSLIDDLVSGKQCPEEAKEQIKQALDEIDEVYSK